MPFFVANSPVFVDEKEIQSFEFSKWIVKALGCSRRIMVHRPLASLSHLVSSCLSRRLRSLLKADSH